MRIITIAALLLATSASAGTLPKQPQATNDVRVVAVCTDGFQWRAHTAKDNGHRFACSHHHGVASWTDGSPVKRKVTGLNSAKAR